MTREELSLLVASSTIFGLMEGKELTRGIEKLALNLVRSRMMHVYDA